MIAPRVLLSNPRLAQIAATLLQGQLLPHGLAATAHATALEDAPQETGVLLNQMGLYSLGAWPGPGRPMSAPYVSWPPILVRGTLPRKPSAATLML